MEHVPRAAASVCAGPQVAAWVCLCRLADGDSGRRFVSAVLWFYSGLVAVQPASLCALLCARCNGLRSHPSSSAKVESVLVAGDSGITGGCVPVAPQLARCLAHRPRSWWICAFLP